MLTSLLQTKMNSDQIVEQFIHSCSHDLRSPLTSIRGLVKVAEYYPQSEEIHNCFKMIENCTDTMDKLIRALEEFMVVNNYKVVPEAINCEDLIDNVVADHQDEITSKGITIRRKDVTPKLAMADQLILSLIFKHIFKNAIAFQDAMKRDKYIDIQIQSDQNFIKIKVSDNGIGFSSTYNQKIFKPFFKASTQSKGVGMGLFLLNNLLNKVKGKISLSSEEQIGTSFTIVIPCLTPIQN
jgi:signal transduction histidine kinase